MVIATSIVNSNKQRNITPKIGQWTPNTHLKGRKMYIVLVHSQIHNRNGTLKLPYTNAKFLYALLMPNTI